MHDNARKRELNEIMKQRHNTQTVVNQQNVSDQREDPQPKYLEIVVRQLTSPKSPTPEAGLINGVYCILLLLSQMFVR